MNKRCFNTFKTIVNKKINEYIKKINKYFNINDSNTEHIFDFYFTPKIIYNGKNFIEIGYFNVEGVFISDFYLLVNPQFIQQEIKEIIDCPNINVYFTKKKIHILY